MHTSPKQPPPASPIPIRNIKRLFALAACAALIGVGLCAPAASASVAAASTAVTCGGNGCNNTDPYATGCASNAYAVAAVTLYKGSTSVAAGYAELWYSNTCGTNWTEVVIYNDGLNDVFSEYGQLNIADGRSLSYSYGSYGTPLWTNQEYAPTTRAQACGQILADSFTTAKRCTGWY